jgi:hypothetical protein
VHVLVILFLYFSIILSLNFLVLLLGSVFSRQERTPMFISVFVQLVHLCYSSGNAFTNLQRIADFVQNLDVKLVEYFKVIFASHSLRLKHINM